MATGTPTRTLQQEIGKTEPFESAEQEAMLNIVRTASVLSAGFSRLMRGHGLSESAYNALRILRGAMSDPRAAAPDGHGGARTCTQIGEHLITQVPDVTRLIDRLAKDGLAERVRSEADRRVVYVRITKKGLGVLMRLDEPVLALHRAQLGHMSRAELRELSRLLEKCRAGDRAGGGDE